MPILLTGGLPNDYREANGYSTEAAYRDGHREVKQERTKAIIQMTFTEKRSTETLLNAESRDGEICKCNIWINCATPEWSPRVLYANHSHNAWSGSSQHCPKSRRDPRDDRLMHRLLPWPIPMMVYA